jgi:hypothetical protein
VRHQATSTIYNILKLQFWRGWHLQAVNIDLGAVLDLRASFSLYVKDAMSNINFFELAATKKPSVREYEGTMEGKKERKFRVEDSC